MTAPAPLDDAVPRAPNPGSDAAIAAGCICAVMDNNHGQYPPHPPDGWWIAHGCPVHHPTARPPRRPDMTGPEHYREAERLLTVNAGKRDDPSEPMVSAAAQVHATLALAAATGLGMGAEEPDLNEWRAWAAAAGTKPT
jgi:hypothetical protein